MFWQSSAVIPAHTPGTDGASRAPHLRVSLVAHSASDFAGAALCTRYGAFWLKPLSIFGLSILTTFIASSHVFTIPSIQPHLRLMLAETPSPHGSGASRVTVGTVSAGSVRVVTFPHICVGYC